MIMMYNPKNHIWITTNLNFKSKWEQLGFVERRQSNDS